MLSLSLSIFSLSVDEFLGVWEMLERTIFQFRICHDWGLKPRLHGSQLYKTGSDPNFCLAKDCQTCIIPKKNI